MNYTQKNNRFTYYIIRSSGEYENEIEIWIDNMPMKNISTSIYIKNNIIELKGSAKSLAKFIRTEYFQIYFGEGIDRDYMEGIITESSKEDIYRLDDHIRNNHRCIKHDEYENDNLSIKLYFSWIKTCYNLDNRGYYE